MTKAHQDQLAALGWTLFDHDPNIEAWVHDHLDMAHRAIADPKNKHWWRCGDTWFVGVNALPNGANGSAVGKAPLKGTAIDFLDDNFGPTHWDQAQISVCTPNYPRQGDDTDAAYAFRKNRDAAHVDGLMRDPDSPRRFVGEYHKFILGIPMTQTDIGASPFVVWDGSHVRLRQMFQERLSTIAPQDWGDMDFASIYAQCRKEIFQTHHRRVLHATVGRAYVIDRHLLHGVAPWQPGAKADPAGRIIAYFRPECDARTDWI